MAGKMLVEQVVVVVAEILRREAVTIFVCELLQGQSSCASSTSQLREQQL
jgi:hypothetical protein